MNRRRYTSLPLVLLVVLFLAGMIPGVAALPTPAHAQSGPLISADPATLNATLALGERRQFTLTLSSNATQSTDLSLALFEALAGPAPGTARTQQPPTALTRVALPRQRERVDPRLREALQQAPAGRARFLVFLGEQADLTAAYRETDWAARGWAVYRALNGTATRSQAALRTLLEQRGVAYQPLWIVNALLVDGSLDDLRTLEARSEVALLQADLSTALPVATAQPATGLRQPFSGCSPDAPSDPNPICWNVRKVSAHRVWREFGVSGQGITVGSIDTGASYLHQALVRQYRGARRDGSFEHNYNWFDPQGRLLAPGDDQGHGTHTLGTMVAAGDGTPELPAVGVAPGAQWIAAKGCEVTTCHQSDLIAAAQWMLAPTDLDGRNPRPDLRPHVVNNSWAGEGDDPWYGGYTTAWRAAGIFPVFAAGNGANVCRSVQSPGDYGDVVGVGATTLNDTIATFSRLGPAADGRLKPDLSAPGYLVLSTYRNSTTSYAQLNGTSMAAPHVAAAVALLWSANPSLIGNYEATYVLLTGNTQRINDARCGDQAEQPNNVYGYGRLDTYAAVAQARVDVPWLVVPDTLALATGASSELPVTLDATRVPGPGNYEARILVRPNAQATPLEVHVQLQVTPAATQRVVQGHVRDASSGAPLVARVQVAGGASASVDATGAYTLTLPLRTEPYLLQAQATGYLSASARLNLDTAGTTITQPFSLTTDLPQLAVTAEPLSATLRLGEQSDLQLLVRNSGTQPLSYTAAIVPELYSLWRSDEPNDTTQGWITPTASVALPLADNGVSGPIKLGFPFTFYGRTYESIYVSANGLVGFTELAATGLFRPGCLPDDNTSGAAILPFRTDLDPARGGQVLYTHNEEGFVLTFEDVPLHGAAPADPSYSFQLHLWADGRIGFVYGALGPLPYDLSVGLQRSLGEVQSLGCGRTTPITSNLALELQPQPLPTLWATVNSPLAELAPGELAVTPIQLNWLRPQWHSQPLRATLLLSSNDPSQRTVRLPITLRTEPAPYESVLPLTRK